MCSLKNFSAFYSSFFALSGWYFLAFFSSSSTTGSGVGFVFILIGSFAAIREIWPDFYRLPVFWVSLFLSGYVLLRSWISLFFFPGLDESHNPHWSHFVEITAPGFLLMGWWLWRCSSKFYWIFCLFLIGILLGVASHLNPEAWHLADSSFRYVLGEDPNYLGMISGGILVALLIIMLTASLSGVHFFIIISLAVLFFVFMLITQSRSAWLAFFLSAGIFLIHYFSFLRYKGLFKLILLFFIFVFFVTLVLSFFGLIPGLIARLHDEHHTLSLVMQGAWHEAILQGGSVGSRLQMWFIGCQAISEKPFFGWGGGIGQTLLSEIEHTHFHNFYIEFLVGYGIFGFSLFVLCMTLLLREVFLSGKGGFVSKTMMLVLFYVTLFVSIVLFFSIRFGQVEGRAFLLMLMACYSFTMFRRRHFS